MKFETKRKLLHIVYPTRCPSCNGYIGANDRFCAGCYSKFIRYSGNFQIPGAASFSSVFLYDDNIHPAITTLKNGVCGNAPYALGSELSELLISNSTARKVDVIIPVPMTRAERKRRGYNQSLLLAKTVSRIIGKPLLRKTAAKIKATRPQKSLSMAERRKNIIGAFAIVDAESIRGKRVLLVDDICTTGSTLGELTRLVMENGALEVHCACCCKTADLHLESRRGARAGITR